MARARAARAPKPLEAPVMTMMFFIRFSCLPVLCMDGLAGGDECRLYQAPVWADYLPVDPAAIGSGQEGDDAGNIVGLAEPLERSYASGLFDQFFALALEEKRSGNGPWGNGIDSDLVSAKFICEDRDEPFDTCFGGDVGAVGGESPGDDAAGEGDDTAALCHVLRCLREDEEGPAGVGGDDLVEGFDVAFGDGRESHDACVVDYDVDLAEGFEGLLEELPDVVGIGDVGLNGEGAAALAGDLVDDLFRLACAAGEVDDDTES